MAEPLTVVFRTKTGEEEVRIFTQQPLGMEFRRVMPIVISRLRGEGQAIQFGVQLGWEVLSINGNPLAGMPFRDAHEIFQAEKKYSKKSGKTDISKINIKKLDRRSIRKRKGKLRKCRRNPPKKGSKLRGEKRHVFYIDCSQPVDDDIFDMASFEQFLKDSIKVAGKKGQLGEAVEVTRTTSKVSVSVNIRFQKRYLKYLTKKFLKKQSLRDYIRVIANAKDSYYLRYFNINQAGGDDDDE